jgi:hypothetical protein
MLFNQHGAKFVVVIFALILNLRMDGFNSPFLLGALANANSDFLISCLTARIKSFFVVVNSVFNVFPQIIKIGVLPAKQNHKTCFLFLVQVLCFLFSLRYYIQRLIYCI